VSKQSSSNRKKFHNNKIKIEENEDGLLIEAKIPRIKNLKDLVKEAEIDLNIWTIDKHIINKWEVGGKGPDGLICITPLWQVKVWLIKKIPDKQVFPPVQPVEINISLNKSKPSKISSQLKKAVIIPDAQIGYRRDFQTNTLDPFHDRLCMDLGYQIISKTNPDKIILLGDMLDLAEWSDKFTKEASFFQTTQPSIIELAWWLGQYRKIAPNANIVYINGNHDSRLELSIFNNHVAAYNLKPLGYDNIKGVLSISNLLGLKALNIECLEYPLGEHWINDNLKCSHGTVARAGSGDTVKAILNECRSSEIVGHIHRMELASKTVHVKNKEITYSVFCPGTFARIDGVVPSKKGRENWQQGLGVVDYEEDNGRFQINPISINNGVCIYNNEILKGRNRVNQLSKDTNWNFN